tara:strand:+ start:238 stop:1035 length:798 start_codon:yes stop_codon:yes gene_type:complete
MKNKFKIIAIDIDGTLKSDSNSDESHTIRILNQCRNLGIKIVVATGRSYMSALDYLHNFIDIDYLISFQGALVTEKLSNHSLWHRHITYENINATINELRNHEVQIVLYSDNDMYVENITSWSISYAERNDIEMILVDDLLDLNIPTYRVLAVGDKSVIQNIEKIMKSRYATDVYATRSLANFCEILNREAGKEQALQWICSQMSISRNEVIAFGNGFNDIEMLNWAGVGVAMANSEKEIVNIADLVIKTSVSEYLEFLIENNKI